jgi:carboxylate-amine ligase
MRVSLGWRSLRALRGVVKRLSRDLSRIVTRTPEPEAQMGENNLTLGVEEEYAIVHPDTRELKSHINTMMRTNKWQRVIGENIVWTPELHQSVVEVATPICYSVADARRDIIDLRRRVIRKAEKTGARIAAVSTHPFSDWKDQKVTNRKRYLQIVADMGDMARANLIFGLHVHVGVPGDEAAVEVMNEARYFLPHLLALSTSSPFWLGRRTGMMSTRAGIFRRFPRTGIPARFNSAAELRSFVNTLVSTGSIPDASKIWWDLRAHHKFPTVEFRICDLPSRVEDTVCIVALVQGIVARLRRLREQNLGFRDYPAALIEENKWRAMRQGVNAKLIDFGKHEEVEFKQLVVELLEFIEPMMDELGSRAECERALKICDEGTSADRQIAMYEKTGRFEDVVDMLVDETRNGVFDHDTLDGLQAVGDPDE